MLTIARDLGTRWSMPTYCGADLYMADEAFMTGTAAEVVPSARSTTGVWAMARPGPVTRKIQETYKAAVRGQVDRYRRWVEHAS